MIKSSVLKRGKISLVFRGVVCGESCLVHGHVGVGIGVRYDGGVGYMWKRCVYVRIKITRDNEFRECCLTVKILWFEHHCEGLEGVCCTVKRLPEHSSVSVGLAPKEVLTQKVGEDITSVIPDLK